jgi:ABC-type phosphate transport system ATPase subunit
MSNIITVKDMCLWYGDHQALKDVSIEIPKRALPHLSALPAAANPPSSRPSTA